MLYDITTNIDYECSICLESINIDNFILYDEFFNNYNDISSLSCIKTHCGHFFHSKCLYLNNLKYSTCPICRQPFAYNNIIDDSNNVYINITENSDDYSQYFLIKFKIPSYRSHYIYIYIHKRNLLFAVLIFLLLITSIILLVLSLIYN